MPQSVLRGAGLSLLTRPSRAAQKLRVAILKELEHIQSGGPGTNELARFEKVEKLMETYRLRCIETIWLDIRAANEKGAEDALWQVHTFVTKAYRKVLGKLQGNDHVVLRRKLEKLYSTNLKTAQYFYRGYLQRTCARYDMKDLRRIARQAELEEMPVPDEDKVDPATAQLQDIVKSSCHKTLIYLGDLARYRTLLRPKDRKWEGALAYYQLANELIPESGYGHHQCSVIYVETEDHLDVVYHLYRALACAIPHPNAPANLEREFRDLQKRKSGGTQHALLTWFVKLHAFYAQGKEFAERKELESEVDHRLAVAMKTGTGYGSDMDLFKIVLINITAFAAAQDKIRANWTDEGSMACQYILLLNIRMIHAIARLLGEEIADLIKRESAEVPAAGPGAAAQAETTMTKFTPAFNRVLPLLRIYMPWLCSYGSQLVEFQAHLEPHFGTMCTTLSNTLTLLFELLASKPQFGNPVPWRFPEDEMTLGIQCLNGPELHNGCQLYYDAFTLKPKPRPDDVTFTRALDVLLCALDVSAPESKFPFTTSTTTKGSRELTNFVYLEGGKPNPTPSVPAIQRPSPTTVPAATEQKPQRPVVAPSPCESNELSEDREFYGPDLRRAGKGTCNGRGRAATGSTQVAPASEYPIEKQLFQILNDFMAPPESARAAKLETPGRSHARTDSYGMGSAIVAEAFASGDSTSPAPGSAGMKPIPTLPWDYFYTPAPVDPALQKSSTSGTGSGWGANGARFSRPASSGNAAQLGAGSTTGNPLGRQMHQRYDSLDQTRLVNQTEALRSLHLTPDRVGQSQQGSTSQRLWPGPLNGESTPAREVPSNPLQQSPWPSANPWQATYGQNQAATNRVPNSSFSNLDFSANTSSLPQVNSPWGLPTAVQRFSAAQQSPSPSASFVHHVGVSAPSSSGSRFPSAYAAAMAGEQTSQALNSAWLDARQPRSGKADGTPVMQGMPQR
ncbi:hypothetical protein C8A03DRAFT_42441 [Achaetomium macrosporum]|uniref:Nonsense-mediated mRNA decay factor n=1 Tax=Achaetomium macrosporum TaxID=79813 RepID=A0AAN7CDE1_9PEZI|nr:hypothetical protein C8A03DRAFT_42441 [Achaetomium macrosporum]